VGIEERRKKQRRKQKKTLLLPSIDASALSSSRVTWQCYHPAKKTSGSFNTCGILSRNRELQRPRNEIEAKFQLKKKCCDPHAKQQWKSNKNRAQVHRRGKETIRNPTERNWQGGLHRVASENRGKKSKSRNAKPTSSEHKQYALLHFFVSLLRFFLPFFLSFFS
jgi:hypothetical protein